MSELPTLQEELNRKTHEAMGWLVKSFLEYKIDALQLSVAMDALFMATAGLVRGDWFAESIHFANELSKRTATFTNYHQVFIKGVVTSTACHHVISISWKHGDKSISVVKMEHSHGKMPILVKEKTQEFETPELAAEWLLDTENKLGGTGWWTILNPQLRVD